MALFSDGKTADGKSRGAFDPGPDSEKDRACGRNLVQIAEDFHLKFALGEYIPLTSQITGLCRLRGSIGIKSLMTIGRGIALLVNIFQCFHGPAREVLAAVLRNA